MRGIKIIAAGDLAELFASAIMQEVCTDHDASRIDHAEAFFDNIARHPEGPRYSADPLLLMTGSLGRFNTETHEIEELRRCQHDNAASFYRVRAHETVHWTMKPLNRPSTHQIVQEAKAIGDRMTSTQEVSFRHRLNVAYCREELVAETGAKLVMNHLNLATPENVAFHDEYMEKYLRALEQNTGDRDGHKKWAERYAQEAFEFLVDLQTR